MTDGVGANGADGGNGITQRSRETEVEQRTVFSVCVSVAPFLCVIPLPPCSPFTHARELEQCRRERSVIEIAAARRNQRIHEASSACVRHRAARSRRGQSPGRNPAEIPGFRAWLYKSGMLPCVGARRDNSDRVFQPLAGRHPADVVATVRSVVTWISYAR